VRARAPRSPRSLSIEVICTSGRPQATTQVNGSSDRASTLAAKPCVVTPRETCTPIDASLRFSTQTPV
jgi:hypothetical protein